MEEKYAEPSPVQLEHDAPSPRPSPASAVTHPLGVISEGTGEGAGSEGAGPLIDAAAAAERACREVLHKLKLRHTDPACDGDEDGRVEGGLRRRPNPSKQLWLLHLFESKLFDVSMAISYLHNSKEPGVQACIGKRLFSFPHDDVDFFLPQLLNMYVHMDEHVGDAIKPYVFLSGADWATDAAPCGNRFRVCASIGSILIFSQSEGANAILAGAHDFIPRQTSERVDPAGLAAGRLLDFPEQVRMESQVPRRPHQTN
ncbi:phosphatidylinositol 4-kinase beta isoform X2 [Syngnathus scovelli]|uniref:phosphatidylinositol 4-kinase beta isoform X2 n=1 Tax=Syngnathus scovelli TaxID=161590 RepID=UPI00211017D0|nr:phosphatidylinositol 4-kinase beta isoform X2 [Syngnathus scovelli]